MTYTYYDQYYKNLKFRKFKKNITQDFKRDISIDIAF